MSQWEMVKLGDVCKKKIDTLKGTNTGLIDYIDISSIDNIDKSITSWQTIESSNAPSRAKQLLEKNDILVSTVRPNLNAVAINDIKNEFLTVASTGYCILRTTAKIDVSYLFNFCKSSNFINKLVKVSKGASYPAVSNTDVKNCTIPLPSIEIQQKIAKTMDTVADLLKLRKQQLAELDQLIQSVFYELFGDPVINEKGWDQVKLGSILFEIKYGTSTPPVFSEEGFSFVRATNIKCGRIIEKDMKFISTEQAEKISKCKLKKGDLIIVRSGVNAGDTCVIMKENQGLYAGYDLIVSPDDNYIDSVFLNELLNTKYMDMCVKPLTRRAAQPHLNADQIKNLSIILPTLSLQTKFAAIVEKIEQQKALVQQSIDETQTLFDSLMSQYFD